eukprot:tig00000711_g3377.t1
MTGDQNSLEELLGSRRRFVLRKPEAEKTNGNAAEAGHAPTAAGFGRIRAKVQQVRIEVDTAARPQTKTEQVSHVERLIQHHESQSTLAGGRGASRTPRSSRPKSSARGETALRGEAAVRKAYEDLQNMRGAIDRLQTWFSQNAAVLAKSGNVKLREVRAGIEKAEEHLVAAAERLGTEHGDEVTAALDSGTEDHGALTAEARLLLVSLSRLVRGLEGAVRDTLPPARPETGASAFPAPRSSPPSIAPSRAARSADEGSDGGGGGGSAGRGGVAGLLEASGGAQWGGLRFLGVDAPEDGRLSPAGSHVSRALSRATTVGGLYERVHESDEEVDEEGYASRGGRSVMSRSSRGGDLGFPGREIETAAVLLRNVVAGIKSESVHVGAAVHAVQRAAAAVDAAESLAELRISVDAIVNPKREEAPAPPPESESEEEEEAAPGEPEAPRPPSEPAAPAAPAAPALAATRKRRARSRRPSVVLPQQPLPRRRPRSPARPRPLPPRAAAAPRKPARPAPRSIERLPSLEALPPRLAGELPGRLPRILAAATVRPPPAAPIVLRARLRSAARAVLVRGGAAVGAVPAAAPEGSRRPSHAFAEAAFHEAAPHAPPPLHAPREASGAHAIHGPSTMGLPTGLAAPRPRELPHGRLAGGDAPAFVRLDPRLAPRERGFIEESVLLSRRGASEGTSPRRARCTTPCWGPRGARSRAAALASRWEDVAGLATPRRPARGLARLADGGREASLQREAAAALAALAHAGPPRPPSVPPPPRPQLARALPAGAAGGAAEEGEWPGGGVPIAPPNSLPARRPNANVKAWARKPSWKLLPGGGLFPALRIAAPAPARPAEPPLGGPPYTYR